MRRLDLRNVIMAVLLRLDLRNVIMATLLLNMALMSYGWHKTIQEFAKHNNDMRQYTESLNAYTKSLNEHTAALERFTASCTTEAKPEAKPKRKQGGEEYFNSPAVAPVSKATEIDSAGLDWIELPSTWECGKESSDDHFTCRPRPKLKPTRAYPYGYSIDDACNLHPRGPDGTVDHMTAIPVDGCTPSPQFPLGKTEIRPAEKVEPCLQCLRSEANTMALEKK